MKLIITINGGNEPDWPLSEQMRLAKEKYILANPQESDRFQMPEGWKPDGSVFFGGYWERRYVESQKIDVSFLRKVPIVWADKLVEDDTGPVYGIVWDEESLAACLPQRRRHFVLSSEAGVG